MGYGKSLARNNVVEYNRIYRIGQGWTSDVAGVYTLGTQPGTVIRHNLIHDVQCADYIGRGIYLDEGSAEIVVENNVIYRTTTGDFGMNYGRRNVIRNNVFAFGERSQIEPVGTMAKAPLGNSYVLERNIFLLQPGGLMGGSGGGPGPPMKWCSSQICTGRKAAGKSISARRN